MVADGWAGAANPHPHLTQPTFNTDTHKLLKRSFSYFSTRVYGQTDGWTDGPTYGPMDGQSLLLSCRFVLGCQIFLLATLSMQFFRNAKSNYLIFVSDRHFEKKTTCQHTSLPLSPAPPLPPTPAPLPPFPFPPSRLIMIILKFDVICL